MTKQMTQRDISYAMINDYIHHMPEVAVYRLPTAGADIISAVLLNEGVCGKDEALILLDEIAAQNRQSLDLAYMACVFLRCWATETGIPVDVLLEDIIKGADAGELPD